MSTMLSPAYPPADADARAALLKWVRQTPLAYGPWRPFKALFKQLEADPAPDAEILGAVLARIDSEPLRSPGASPCLKLDDLRQVQQAHLTGDLLTVIGSNRGWGNPDRITSFRLAADNPLVATSVKSQTFAGGAHDIVVSQNRVLWVESTSRFLWKLNAATLDLDASGAEINTSVALSPAAIAVANGFAFVAAESLSTDRGRGGGSGVRVFSLASGIPEPVADVALENAIKLQAVPERNLLAVQTGSTGFRWGRLPSKSAIHFFDISNPAQPREVGRIAPTINEWLLVGDLLLTTDGDTLSVHTTSEARTVKEIGRWRYPEAKRNPYRSTTLTLPGGVGSSVFVGVQYETGWTRLDLSNPRLPAPQSEMTVTQDGRVIGQRGDLLYILQNYGGVSVWDVSALKTPTRLGARPSPETFGYLKRRARRLLHRLGEFDSRRYVAVVSAMLQEAADPHLDLQRQWVSVDTLFGGTDAYVQMSHGRGSYVPNRNVKRRIALRRRDERFPSAWNAQPEHAARLLNAPKAASETYALAIRVLRANKKTIPVVTNTGALGRMLDSTVPLLKVYGAQGAVALAQKGAKLPASVAALAFLTTNAAGRAVLSGSLDTSASNAKWTREFSSELLNYIANAWRSTNGNIKALRRALPAIALLSERFSDQVGAEQILPLIPALLLSRRQDFTALVVNATRKTNPMSLLPWLQQLSHSDLTDSDREPVVVALEELVRNTAPPRVLLNLLSADHLSTVQALAWRLLAASTVSVEQAAELWRLLLDRPQQTPSLESAMTSPYALQLLAKANLPADEIASRLQSRPFLGPLLSEETFGQLVQTASVEALLALTSGLDDTTFARLRSAWLRPLREGIGSAPLWHALPEVLKADENGRIASRILEDTEFTTALVDLPADQIDTVLAVYEPLMDNLVTEWARRHENAFPADSEPLTQAATSPLGAFRAWGLARVADKGLRLPVALRLMESDLPDSLALGRDFFARVGEGDKQALDFALALCDSPARAVRRYGRTFVTERWNKLPRTDLYTALFEHSDPEMRQWVANLLGDEPAPDTGGIDTAPFDRDVLRSRDTARAAKEKIKTRVARTGTVDTGTLLALARGTGTPRDAEWALTQLARRALAGEKIEGFSVDGVAG